jgi:hypothetical protein
MGIRIEHPASALSEKAFHQLDYQVMALAFDLYNSIGNLWEENDYKTKLLERCIAGGFTQHGKIINFRRDSLEWRFVSTSLTFDQRKSYTLKTNHWIPNDSTNAYLPDFVSELLDDWGAYLDIQLYREAILFFMNPPPGNTGKRFCQLTPETLIHFTGLSRNKSAYQKNLQKYLNASTSQQIDWINFDRHEIELHTLEKKSFCR